MFRSTQAVTTMGSALLFIAGCGQHGSDAVPQSPVPAEAAPSAPSAPAGTAHGAATPSPMGSHGPASNPGSSPASDARAPAAAMGAAGSAAAPMSAPGETSGLPTAPAAPTAPAQDMPMEAFDGTTTVIAASDLAQPSDLEFNPYVEDELWVMNQGDSSTLIVSNASSDQRSAERRLDIEGSLHFMPNPTAFAFGGRETTIVDAQGEMVEGTFATCPGVNQEFMGPTLWTSDLRIFAITKTQREPPFNGPDTGLEGPGSHIDMLHRTPLCTGIAWEGAGNVYWTYSRAHEMFVKYDFAKDHGIGNADHSDGSIWRYPMTDILAVSTAPSHLQYDVERKLLYMADSGHSRIVTFDPASATESSMASSLENLDGLRQAVDLNGGKLNDLVPSSYGLKLPSGLEIHGQALYVSDNETSTIHKFSLEGAPLGKAVIPDVAPGGLAGLDFGPDGKLYFVDMLEGRVLRLEEEF
jgi:hypothetical protein